MILVRIPTEIIKRILITFDFLTKFQPEKLKNKMEQNGIDKRRHCLNYTLTFSVRKEKQTTADLLKDSE